MAEWPAGLPAPQKKISITPGDTRVERKLQSGRTEFRRFGDGKPDQAKVLFRLLWVQWETFKTFYEYDLNLGLNWFSASWLAGLGYSEHKAKFLGYPREVARQGYYVDIVCTLMVQKTAWIIGEDTEWPCAATGGEPPPAGEFGYIYGGITACLDCDQYDSDLDIWTSKTDMLPPARGYLAASTIGSSGYVYGGDLVSDCDEYTSDTWASMLPMPNPSRKKLAASTIGSSGYVYGGNSGGSAFANYLLDCDEYAPSPVDTWTSKSNFYPSIPREGASASTIGSSGYVYGGYYGGSYPQELQNCDQYTPDTWVSKTDMPYPKREYTSATTIGNSGYLFGGESNYGGWHLQDCDQYTPDTWVSKTDMPSPGGEWLAASTIGNNGYIYGGRNVGTDCDKYTPDTNVWLSKTDLPSPARNALAASTIAN